MTVEILDIEVQQYLDFMVEFGAYEWARWAFVFALLSYALSSVVPHSYPIFIGISTLFLAILAVTLWWDHYGSGGETDD